MIQVIVLNKLLKCQKYFYYFYFKIYLLYNLFLSPVLDRVKHFSTSVINKENINKLKIINILY